MSSRPDLNVLAQSVFRLTETVDRLQETVRRQGYRLQAIESELPGSAFQNEMKETVEGLESAIDWLIHQLKDTQERLAVCERQLQELGAPAEDETA